MKFHIFPQNDHFIAELIVDGSSEGMHYTWLFKNVTANHTILAEFKPKKVQLTMVAEPVEARSTQNITWTSSKLQGNMVFKLYNNGALVNLNPPIPAIPADAGTVVWSIPQNLPVGIAYNFRIESQNDPSVYSSGGIFAITATDSTATLTMEVNPTGTGQVLPASGTVETNKIIEISATSAEGWKFLRWTATPKQNVKLADPNAAQTYLLIVGDVAVAGLFAKISEKQIFPYTAKAKITLVKNFAKPLPPKDKVLISKAFLPITENDVPTNSKITIHFDDFNLRVDANRKTAKNKISFSGTNNDKTNKYSLVFDFGKQIWSFNFSNANMADGIDSTNGIVPRDARRVAFGEKIGVGRVVSWKFNSTKDGSDEIETEDNVWENFDILNADSQADGLKLNKGKFTVSKGLGDPMKDFDPTKLLVVVQLTTGNSLSMIRQAGKTQIQNTATRKMSKVLQFSFCLILRQAKASGSLRSQNRISARRLMVLMDSISSSH